MLQRNLRWGRTALPRNRATCSVLRVEKKRELQISIVSLTNHATFGGKEFPNIPLWHKNYFEQRHLSS